MPTRDDYIAWLRKLSAEILKIDDLVSLPFVISVKGTPTVAWFTYTLCANELTVKNIYRVTYNSNISKFNCELKIIAHVDKTKLTEIQDDLIYVLADGIQDIIVKELKAFYCSKAFEDYVPDDMLAVYRQMQFYASELPAAWNGEHWESIS